MNASRPLHFEGEGFSSALSLLSFAERPYLKCDACIADAVMGRQGVLDNRDKDEDDARMAEEGLWQGVAEERQRVQACQPQCSDAALGA